MITEFDLINLSTFILSPGNIIWKKSNNSELIVAEKNGLLNMDMIHKLYHAGHTLEIRNQIDFSVIQQFKTLFDDYQQYELLGDRIFITNKILALLKSYLIETQSNQSDLNHLCLKVFAEIDSEQLIHYINLDFDYFIRAQNIASSYVIIAFILGYYNFAFLKNLFNSTIKDLMVMRKHVPGFFLIDSLTKFQKELDPPENSRATLLNIKNSIKISNQFIFERLDGKGLNKIKANNMTNLEIIFCNLCYHYEFDQPLSITNIIDQVNHSQFHLSKPLLNEIMNNLGVLND